MIVTHKLVLTSILNKTIPPTPVDFFMEIATQGANQLQILNTESFQT